MELLIKIWNSEVTIFLIKNKKILDSFAFELDRDMSERLLPEIDKLLKKNKLESKDIKKARFKTNIKNSYTTVRIAQVVVNVFNWVKTQNTP